MSRKSKREIEREVEDLQPSEPDGGTQIIMNMCHVQGTGKGTEPVNWSDSPHPELSYKPFPEEKPYSLKIAAPHFIPEPWNDGRALFIETCEGDDTHGTREDPDHCLVAACELWDALSEEELKREAKYRVDHDEPLPALLVPYAPE